MTKRYRKAVTEFEDKAAELEIQRRFIRQKIESYDKERIQDLVSEYESGKIIVSQVSEWDRLQLSHALPNVEVEYFTKLVYFHFTMINHRPVINKLFQLDRIRHFIRTTFHSKTPVVFTSHAKMDIADQCQKWLDEYPMVLEDQVVWDSESRESGLACHGIEYLYTIPKK
jgi:hypothetical protein